jgi:hypothetical protein
MKLRLRIVALVLVISALLLAVSASAASAAYYGITWLDWAYVGAEKITWSEYEELKQVATQPKSHDWGCGNMWESTHYVFGVWYCGSPSSSSHSPALEGYGVPAEPVAWNDSTGGQDLWAWEYVWE